MLNRAQRSFLLTTIMAAIFSLGVYSFLYYLKSSDAKFFSIVSVISIMFATSLSPEWNIIVGIKKIPFFDWLVIFFISFFPLFMAPDEVIAKRIIVCVCLFIYMACATIVFKRKS